MEKIKRNFEVTKTAFWILFIALILTRGAFELKPEKEQSKQKPYIAEVLTQEFEKTNGSKPFAKDGVFVASSIEQFYLDEITEKELKQKLNQIDDSTKSLWIKTLQGFDNKKFNKKVKEILNTKKESYEKSK